MLSRVTERDEVRFMADKEVVNQTFAEKEVKYVKKEVGQI